MIRRLRRAAAQAAIAALIANIALPVIVALSFAAATPASASLFPICSAHAALLGDTAPAGPAGGAPSRAPAPGPLGCPLCPAPLPADIPAVPSVIPLGWPRAVVPMPAVDSAFRPAAKPSPVWPHAPPSFS